MVEFALILPLFVLILVGIFDLGRAFFASIAISNAAREGARVFTFSPDKTTITNINTAVHTEVATYSVVDPTKIGPIEIQCVDPISNTFVVVDDITYMLKKCKSGQPVRITVTYAFDFILRLFLPDSLILKQSAEMMVP